MIGKAVGNYWIKDKIGAGGMGEVYLAEDTRLGRKAAIKVLPDEWAKDPERRQRFLKEAKAAAALNHPHVCTIYDVGETEEGVPFIAMEFVDGQSLEALVRSGPIPHSRIVAIAIQIADALDAAHASQIVHRDIKSANIQINERGQVKVLDFGLAKRIGLEPDAGAGDTEDFVHTEPGSVMGTPSHMSPEQALGQEVDHRTDIFSFGVVLYHMATGQLPFTGGGVGEIINKIVNAQPSALARLNYDIPPELERITLKCLQKSRERRYQSARELLVDLQSLARSLESGVTLPASEPPMPAGTSRAPMPASLESSDILLNYAEIDDQPLLEGKPGWVSELHRNLELRVEQLSGEKVRIARVPASANSSELDAKIVEHLPRVKAMVSVLSPPFIKSKVCQREVEEFWRIAERTGGRWVEGKARLLKVIKTAMPNEEMPPVLADIFSPLFGFEFFEMDPDTGRVREFDETFGPVLKQRFFERVYDLAYDVSQVLKVLRQLPSEEEGSADEDPTRQWVYLAATTSDVQDERDRIKRELLERGHSVLPDAVLPTLSRDAEAVVRQCLERCTISVHLLGRHYGMTPEDSSESIPALQVRLSAQQAHRQHLQRLIWLPSDGVPPDERQVEFIRQVQEDPELHYRSEIIEGNLNLLKKELIRHLTAPIETSKPSGASGTETGPPKLYLICGPGDEEAVEALEDFLFAQGIEICLPAFDGSDADADALHRENLLTCDAVLVYYGSTPKAWVDIKLRELLKANGYGRPAPIQVQAVYVAPPNDHRKERFRSHQAQVLRQPAEFVLTAELEAFAGNVKEASS